MNVIDSNCRGALAEASAVRVDDDFIRGMILTLRGVQIILDRDIAMLYGVETKVLNQAVKRNRERFPDRFMFQLTDNDIADLRSQIVTLNKRQGQHTDHGCIFSHAQGVGVRRADACED